MQGLASDGAHLAVYDPKVPPTQILKDLDCPKFEWDHPNVHRKGVVLSDKVTTFTDPYEACKGGARTLRPDRVGRVQGLRLREDIQQHDETGLLL